MKLIKRSGELQLRDLSDLSRTALWMFFLYKAFTWNPRAAGQDWNHSWGRRSRWGFSWLGILGLLLQQIGAARDGQVPEGCWLSGPPDFGGLSKQHSVSRDEPGGPRGAWEIRQLEGLQIRSCLWDRLAGMKVLWSVKHIAELAPETVLKKCYF